MLQNRYRVHFASLSDGSPCQATFKSTTEAARLIVQLKRAGCTSYRLERYQELVVLSGYQLMRNTYNTFFTPGAQVNAYEPEEAAKLLSGKVGDIIVATERDIAKVCYTHDLTEYSDDGMHMWLITDTGLECLDPKEDDQEDDPDMEFEYEQATSNGEDWL